ncbi:MAG: dihydrolipoyl dehydrogenase family protein [Gaiellaceae bacterium]
MPTKALVRAAEIAHDANHAGDFGIDINGVSVDFGAVMARVRRVIDDGTAWVEEQIDADPDIDLYREQAVFTSPTTLTAGDASIEFRHALLAPGADPAALPVAGTDSTRVVTSDDLLKATTLPEHLVVIGAGAVGLEFAQAYSRLGARVTVLHRGEHIAKSEDPELADLLAEYLREEGIDVRTGAGVERIEEREPGVAVHTSDGGVVEGDRVLIAAGRAPALPGLELAAAGVETANGLVQVDDELRTSASHIYAIGDSTGGLMFTHVATYEAPMAVANMLEGSSRKPDYRVIPRAIFTAPELAGVGLTEPEAIESGHDVEIRRHDVGKIGKARAIGDRRGRVKFVVDATSGELLGAHILARHGADLLPGSMVAMNAPNRDLGPLLATIHPHPTLSEAVKIAARSRPS